MCARGLPIVFKQPSTTLSGCLRSPIVSNVLGRHRRSAALLVAVLAGGTAVACGDTTPQSSPRTRETVAPGSRVTRTAPRIPTIASTGPQSPMTTATVSAGGVFVSVQRRGVQVGPVKDLTPQSCPQLGCRRHITTDVLDIHEFDPGPAAEQFASAVVRSGEVHDRGRVMFVRVIEGGPQPYDPEAVRAGLAELGFTPLSPGG
jgi:hypothetical protein